MDLSDVEYSQTEILLGVFLRSAGAVLFGSDFQSYRHTLNETQYAMDELARYSSYALSNILVMFPRLIAVADGLLGKRTSELLNFLHSCPEVSIQRSLIVILRALYGHSSKLDSSPCSLKRRIENGLSTTRFGNGAALPLFKSFDICSENLSIEADAITAKMFEYVDIESRCFTCDCSVRMKGRVNGRLKKGGAVKATVDWNQNSIVVHVKNQDAACFPLFAVTNMRWVKSQKEVRLTLKREMDLTETGLWIELKHGNRAMLAGAIKKRIARIQQLVEANQLSVGPRPKKERKTSHVGQWDIRTEGCEEGEDFREAQDEEAQPVAPISGVEKTRSEENGSENPDYWEMEGKSIDGDVDEEDEDYITAEAVEDDNGSTVFTGMGADGILLLDDSQQTIRGQPPKDDNESDATKTPIPSSSEDEVEDIKEEIDSRDGERPHRLIRNLSRTPSPGNQEKIKVVAPSPNVEPQGGEEVDSSPTAAENDSEGRESADDPPFEPRDEVRHLDSSADELQIANDPMEENANCDAHKDPGRNQADDVDKHFQCLLPEQRRNHSDRKFGCSRAKANRGKQITGNTINRKAGANLNMQEPAASVSVKCDSQGESQISLHEPDKDVCKRLLTAVRELVKRHDYHSVKLSRDTETKIKKARAAHAEKDRLLLSKFAGIVKQQVSSQKRRIAQYKTKRLQEIRETKDRLLSLKRAIQEGAKRMRGMKQEFTKDIGQAKTEMKRMREQLGREMDAFLSESLRKKSRGDSLCEGIAKLLQDGNFG